MPYPSYNPWSEASGSFNQAGNSVNALLLDLARQNYRQQMFAQQMALRQKQLQDQQAYHQAAIQAQQAMAAQRSAQGAIDTEKLSNARSFGSSFARANVPTYDPLMAGEGPTRQAESELLDQRALVDQATAAAIASALAGQPQRASEFMTKQSALRTATPMSRDIAEAILTGTKSQVPIAHEGSLYNVGTGNMVVTPQDTGPGHFMSPGTSSVQPISVPPLPSSSQAGSSLSKNNALNARMNPMYRRLPDNVRGLIEQVLTNAVPSVSATNVPLAAPQAQPQKQIPSFSSSQEARMYGFGSNDVVHIQGVGTVRLH